MTKKNNQKKKVYLEKYTKGGVVADHYVHSRVFN